MLSNRVRDILAAKGNAIYTIERSTKIDEALTYMVKNKLSSCLAVNKDGTIAGVFTARDFLRFMDKVGEENHAGGCYLGSNAPHLCIL